ncbi:hypothetical protein V6N12_057872 [Hibiscus sabdariffa]|uniref:Uncharacterized protein n=1 Tax=Hibiscus sabdariffa TaxID=183260 RepID=A0ABR2B405_9ROSI
MRLPGFEPGSIVWKAIILTVGLQTQDIYVLSKESEVRKGCTAQRFKTYVCLEAVNVFPPSLPKALYCTISFSFLVLKLMMRPCCLSQFWEGRIGVLDGKKRKKNEKWHNDKHFGGNGGEKGTVKKLGMYEEDE